MAEKKYKKHDMRTHMYTLPDTYIGSVEETVAETHVYSDSTNSMVRKNIHYVPGLYKIYDEIIVNALDHATRLKTVENARQVKSIQIDIDQTTGYITVTNDGNGIDIVQLSDHGNVWAPSMVFGEFLTSENYREDEERLVGGKNGVGAKATNVFSKYFEIETVDHHRKKIFTQVWKDNMKVEETPVIKSYSKVPYTRVKFLPDYARFGLKGLTQDMYDLFKRRAFDACACTDPSVSIFFNGQKLETKSFEKLVDLFLGDKSMCPRVYEQPHERWEVIAAPSDTGFQHVTYVNGINCLQGGKATDYIINQITKRLCEMIESKKKKTVKPQHVKDNLFVFVKCQIVNPSFSSQTKEYMTTQPSKFGSKAELSDKFFNALYKTGIVDNVIAVSEALDAKKEKKTDGKKVVRLVIPGLDDAEAAGTKDSDKCTLILTEGLSAKAMAVAGLSVIGRKYTGIYALRGKVANVKDMRNKSINDIEEIANLKKIMGLESGKDYADLSSLRYGRVMALVDADDDGIHIRGLLINAFQTLWPSLYKRPGFFVSMVTPIVKVMKGKDTQAFYTLTDYEKWRKAEEAKPNGLRGWNIKYYKGLGTSTSAEAKEYFSNMHILEYQHTPNSDEAIDLAFNKKRADDRKEWLATYDRNRVLDFSHQKAGDGGSVMRLPFEDFVHKELIHFSQADLERSIASMVDGLKTSQRKILYSCFKRRLYNQEIRVAQLAGYVSEVSAYHHGEVSLQGAIVNLAQDYVGANNIPLLEPVGQFGTRIAQGKDAASARYIHTHLSSMARKLFREEDFPILNYLDDDGYPVEPEYYVPILPLALVNGALGIGTGYSMTVPSFNPTELLQICASVCSGMLAQSEDTVEMAKHVIQDTPIHELKPWYLGFTGTFEKKTNTSYISKGVYHWVDDNTVEITELPVQKGMEAFQDRMNKLISENNPVIKSYTPLYTEKRPHFQVKLYPGSRNRLSDTELEDLLQLSSSDHLSLNNINLFNGDGVIHHYDSIEELIREWAVLRVEKYHERKKYQLNKMEQQRVLVDARVKFLSLVTTGELKVANRPIAELEADLEARKFPKLSLKEDAEGQEDPNSPKTFDYLVNMQIRRLTKEEKNRLEEQLKKLMEDIKNLKKTPVAAMWLQELNEFETEWEKYQASYLEAMNGKGNTIGKKPAAKRTKAH